MRGGAVKAVAISREGENPGGEKAQESYVLMPV
jgi:hypothetical protein